MPFDPLSLSPFPVVDTTSIAIPKDGFFLKRNTFCSKRFIKDNTCKSFYESLTKSTPKNCVQCPFGFSVYPFDLSGRRVAITSFINFPRLGGDVERLRAKEFPDTKLSSDAVVRAASLLEVAEQERIDSISEHFKKYPAALHEVRKLNRTIKQEAERLCLEENDRDPDRASPPLVSIWKSSELMTYQFEILELLANETLTQLERKTKANIYKIFDKCTRIYEMTAKEKNIWLDLNGTISPYALVCDKTFPIIATVLLENAIKYALPDTTIKIRIKQIDKALPQKRCIMYVENLCQTTEILPNIFEKGVRGKSGGLGFGLYLANLVAKQHGSELKLIHEEQSSVRDVVIISMELDVIEILPAKM